jgi:phosphoribosylformimino-5-aminoimidazole carboxamide ribotide isomerase
VTSDPAPFAVIPAVDIRGGRCVRLYRGQADQQTVFDEDPVRVALRWEDQGASLLHVVDLDGAFEGRPVNDPVVVAITGALKIPVQVGGGIRSTETALRYIDAGVSRVVVGTAAFEDPDWLAGLAAELGERLAVGLDTRSGKVAVEGWVAAGGEGLLEAARRLEAAGVRRLIYTDVLKDGTLEGPDLAGLEALANVAGVPVIASGGVSTVDDIKRVASFKELGVEGIVVGMALYKGNFELRDAIRAVEERCA